MKIKIISTTKLELIPDHDADTAILENLVGESFDLDRFGSISGDTYIFEVKQD